MLCTLHMVHAQPVDLIHLPCGYLSIMMLAMHPLAHVCQSGAYHQRSVAHQLVAFGTSAVHASGVELLELKPEVSSLCGQRTACHRDPQWLEQQLVLEMPELPA